MSIRQGFLASASLLLALGITACGGVQPAMMQQQMAMMSQVPSYSQQPGTATAGGGYAYEKPPETGYNYDSGDGVTLPGTEASPDPNALNTGFNNGLNNNFMGSTTGFGNTFGNSFGMGMGNQPGYRDPYGNNYGMNNGFGMGYGNGYGSGYNNNTGYNSGYGSSFGAYSTGTQRAQF